MDKKIKKRAELIWRNYDSLNSEKKETIINHKLEFYVSGSGYGQEMKLIIDKKDRFQFGGGILGPEGFHFANDLNNMKEFDALDIGWVYEPGEYNIFFTRRKDLIYFCPKDSKKGYFMKYSYFMECIWEGLKKPEEEFYER